MVNDTERSNNNTPDSYLELMKKILVTMQTNKKVKKCRLNQNIFQPLMNLKFKIHSSRAFKIHRNVVCTGPPFNITNNTSYK